MLTGARNGAGRARKAVWSSPRLAQAAKQEAGAETVTTFRSGPGRVAPPLDAAALTTRCVEVVSFTATLRARAPSRGAADALGATRKCFKLAHSALAP